MRTINRFAKLGITLAALFLLLAACRRPEEATPSEPTALLVPAMPKAGEVRTFGANGMVYQKDSAIVLDSRYPDYVFWIPVWYNPDVPIYSERPAYRENTLPADSIRLLFTSTFGALPQNQDSARSQLEFMTSWLNETGLSLDDAMDLVKNSGFPTDDQLIENIGVLHLAYEVSAVKYPLVAFNSLLERKSIDWAAFNAAVSSAGTNPTSFWQQMAQKNRGPEILLRQWQLTRDSSLSGLSQVVRNVMQGRLLSPLRQSWESTELEWTGTLFSAGAARAYDDLQMINFKSYTQNKVIRYHNHLFKDVQLTIDYLGKHTVSVFLDAEPLDAMEAPGSGLSGVTNARLFSKVAIRPNNQLPWWAYGLLYGKADVKLVHNVTKRDLDGIERLQHPTSNYALDIDAQLEVTVNAGIIGQKQYEQKVVFRRDQ